MAPTVSKTINEAAVQITRDDRTLGSEFGEAAGPVTFAFREWSPFGLVENFSQFNNDQIAAAEQALDLWSDVANISFQHVQGANGSNFTNDATILFGNYNMPNFGGGYSNDSDVWINQASPANANPFLGGDAFRSMIHEIGHAIGLEHPGDYNHNAFELRADHLPERCTVHRRQPAVHGDELLWGRCNRRQSRGPVCLDAVVA